MDRWQQVSHEFIVIAWLEEHRCWSITWHCGVRQPTAHEFSVKISEAILKIEDWMSWRSETLDACWLPNSWSQALLECWSRGSMQEGARALLAEGSDESIPRATISLPAESVARGSRGASPE